MNYFCCTDLRRDAVKHSANLNGIDFLEVLDTAAPLFSTDDFINLSSLVGKLTAAMPDAVSGFLMSQFSNEIKGTLVDPDSTVQDQAVVLVVGLNNVIKEGSSIYDKARFTGVALSQKTLNLLAQNPTGVELTRLNRLLLEDSYPSEIAKSPDRQRTLFVHFLKALAPNALDQKNIRIEGGERIANIQVTNVSASAETLTVEVDKPGDFSIYTLRLLKDGSSTDPDEPPPDGFDALLSAVEFSFKVECPNDFDCKPTRECPPEPRVEPELDYLAKDYNSFRQLMFDRMSALMPQWRERNAADLGVAMVELLAYVGDHLSYQQDAIATEAYLGTALHRVSARRHARLVDYWVHDGCNARAWIHLETKADSVFVSQHTQLFTRLDGQPARIPTDPQVYNRALAKNPTVFETMHDIMLFTAHNEDDVGIKFYTWGESECCLPEGATRATLVDDVNNRLRLCVGDVLIFEERLGPKTGNSADADPARRHAVRLSRVKPAAELVFEITDDSLAVFRANGIPADAVDQLSALKDQEFADEQSFVAQLQNTIGDDAANNYQTVIKRFSPNRRPTAVVTDPLTNQSIVEIEWANEDALPFPLCLSSKTDEEHGAKEIADVSVALGNNVLADHGMTIANESLGMVPDTVLFLAPDVTADRCAENPLLPISPRYRPALDKRPLTQIGRVIKTQIVAGRTETVRLPFDPNAPAAKAFPAKAFQWKMADTLPAIQLTSVYEGRSDDWMPQKDLLNSDGNKTEFVAEVDNDGTAYLRFGDGEHGRRPDPETTFSVTYRVGNGVAGNVGADSLVHLVSDDARITSVRNPLAARGGVEPESIEDVRQRAPYAFRTQERAVTANDYALMALRDQEVQRAAGTFRWTGSWRTMFVTIDRFGGAKVDDAFKQEIEDELEAFRMAGQDLDVNGPIYVSLAIEMQVCVKPDYFRSAVKQTLLEIFSNRILPDGRLGVFHPDNFTFGQTVFLSRLYAAAQAVEGVESVMISKFQRQGTDSDIALKAEKLEVARLEIARCDNDPNFPEHGVFRLTLDGGK